MKSKPLKLPDQPRPAAMVDMNSECEEKPEYTEKKSEFVSLRILLYRNLNHIPRKKES